MVLSQSLGYLCSYMKFKFLFFLSSSKSKSLQLFLQKKEVECDIIGIRTAVLETETNSLYHDTNGIRLQVMFSFCIFIVCLVKVIKPLQKLCTNNLAQRRMQKRSWSVKKTFARTDQTTWKRVKLRYFDVCVLLNFFMTTQPITNLTPSTPKAFGYHPPTETTRIMLTSTLLNMTYFTTKHSRIHDNLPKAQRRALRLLKQRHDIVIKSADEGSATVINGQKMVLRRMLLPTQQSYFFPTTEYWSYCTTETSYRRRQTNAQRWTYPQKNQTIPIT